MCRRGRAGAEVPGRLDDNTHAEIAPGEGRGVTFGEDPNPPVSDLQPALAHRDRRSEATVHRVTREQPGHRLCRPQLVHCDHFEIHVSFFDDAIQGATHPAEPVDANASRHDFTEPLQQAAE